jgi:transcriptional regulator NrdR family protein
MFVRHRALYVQEAASRIKSFLIAINCLLYRNSLDILHKKEKNVCDECGEKFTKYEDLINHARHIHHHPIVKCNECGKEFIHEKDRLHHVREEHKKKVEGRQLKNLHQRK